VKPNRTPAGAATVLWSAEDRQGRIVPQRRRNQWISRARLQGEGGESHPGAAGDREGHALAAVGEAAARTAADVRRWCANFAERGAGRCRGM